MRTVSRHSCDAVAVAAVFVSARRARGHHVGGPEERVFRAVNGASDRLRVPVWVVMQSGSLAAVFVAAADQHHRGNRATAKGALVAGVLVWAGVKAVKPRIGRGRPDRHLENVSVRGKPQTGLGYPSGHAAVATTLAFVTTRDSSGAAKAIAVAIAWLTGGARMYAGAHLPLDVVGGTAIGVLCGRATTGLLNSSRAWLRP